MQSVRRKIVKAILEKTPISPDWVASLRRTYELLSAANDGDSYQRDMRASSDTFSVNIKDEVIGLRKDLAYLDQLQRGAVDLTQVLARFHPVHEAQFHAELAECKRCQCSFTQQKSN